MNGFPVRCGDTTEERGVAAAMIEADEEQEGEGP